MFNLTEDIARFLESHGFETEFQVCDCFDVIAVKVKDSYRRIMLHPVVADTMEKAEAEQARWDRAMQTLDDRGMLVLTEDRWYSQRKMMEARLLAHLEIFDQVYARNCEIRKIDKATAAEFLEQNHSYGDASCRYRYGMFLKRHTGHCPSAQSVFQESAAFFSSWLFSSVKKHVCHDSDKRRSGMRPQTLRL